MKNLVKRNPNWKTSRPGYIATHDWVSSHYGVADRCENKRCAYENPLRYEWANISGMYLRERSDWMRLCPSCHRKRDFKNRGPKNICIRGHEMKGRNLIIESRGTRTCRECKRIRARKAYMKNPQKVIDYVNNWRKLHRNYED